MRSTSISLLGLGLLAVAGVLFTNHPSSTQPAAKKFVRWEYKVVNCEDIIPNDEADLIQGQVKGLNKLGDEGWQLAVARGGCAIFQRPK